MRKLVLAVVMFVSQCGGQPTPPDGYLVGDRSPVVQEVISDNFKCYILKWEGTYNIIDARCYPKE